MVCLIIKYESAFYATYIDYSKNNCIYKREAQLDVEQSVVEPPKIVVQLCIKRIKEI